MKNLKLFKRIKSLTAYFLIPTSLVGTITLTGFTNVQATAEIESKKPEPNYILTSCVEEVERPIFCKMEEDSSFVGTSSVEVIEVPKDSLDTVVMEEVSAVEEDKENEEFDLLTVVRQMRKIINEDASIYISVEQGSMLITITGKNNKQIQNEEFYTLFNKILSKNPDIMDYFIFLNNYHNQIDFTKLDFSKDASFTISVNDSQDVYLEGVIENIHSISVANSSIHDLQSVSEYLNANGGYISLKGNEQYKSLNQTIQKITQDNNVFFDNVHLLWEESNQAVYLPSLKNLQADTIFMNFNGESSLSSSITFNNYTNHIVIYDIPQKVEVKARDNANVRLNYMDYLDNSILNCPTIYSLQNTNMNLYFQYGPKETQDKAIQMKITDKKVNLQSEYEGWTVSSAKNESGNWEFAVNYLDEIEQAKVLG